MSQFENNSIFWVEVEKINPNPYQPRREFNEKALEDLAESIRQYGVLQPLVVTRNEIIKDDGGLKVEYELIAGERRHRASKLANLSQVPVIIRSGREDAQVKLELAIIENLQREDLNPIERAQAFDRLSNEFEFTHTEIAKKIGKSRVYVSNSIRLLKLPEKVREAVSVGKITEGHARAIQMLRDKPEELDTLFKEVMYKKLTVRETEQIARRVARDKVRKKETQVDPETIQLEEELSETFGTRVKIEKRDVGGKLVIDFFSPEDLKAIIELVNSKGEIEMEDLMEKHIREQANQPDEPEEEEEGETLSEAIARVTREKKAAQEPSEEDESTDDEVVEEEASEVSEAQQPEQTEAAPQPETASTEEPEQSTQPAQDTATEPKTPQSDHADSKEDTSEATHDASEATSTPQASPASASISASAAAAQSSQSLNTSDAEVDREEAREDESPSTPRYGADSSVQKPEEPTANTADEHRDEQTDEQQPEQVAPVTSDDTSQPEEVRLGVEQSAQDDNEEQSGVVNSQAETNATDSEVVQEESDESAEEEKLDNQSDSQEEKAEEDEPTKKEESSDMYSISNFSI